MVMHPTPYLEHYADIYAANMLYKHGVKLDAYLADPARYEHLLGAPFPLTHKQTTVRVRLIREEVLQEQAEEIAQQLDDLPRNNVRPFEPLHHKRHPKRRGLASCRNRSLQPTKPQTT
ncbi:hypothetical protein EZI54_03855 [Marinobacter halodurans]|uniref:DUF2007 domain-containing protein n=1 Tax=Marinobacter halodurans TaxID=2528979 RepID=A0ABY1ZPK3_9GAMM|nr:hypothetical protein [Marinobacter halodurans]TBW58528.1 hypothetical protein EZI54_03855 [Marinobacter halodurans]